MLLFNSGILNLVIFPGDGKKFLEGSSAYSLHSIECPDFLILYWGIELKFKFSA